jgi:hypothetical protein
MALEWLDDKQIGFDSKIRLRGLDDMSLNGSYGTIIGAKSDDKFIIIVDNPVKKIVVDRNNLTYIDRPLPIEMRPHPYLRELQARAILPATLDIGSVGYKEGIATYKPETGNYDITFTDSPTISGISGLGFKVIKEKIEGGKRKSRRPTKYRKTQRKTKHRKTKRR